MNSNFRFTFFCFNEQDCVNQFDSIVAQYGGSRSDYYCGITNDLDTRASQHNAEFLAAVKGNTLNAAKSLEETLANCGYDCGAVQGNVHTPDSKYVYIYKKSETTIE